MYSNSLKLVFFVTFCIAIHFSNRPPCRSLSKHRRYAVESIPVVVERVGWLQKGKFDDPKISLKELSDHKNQHPL